MTPLQMAMVAGAIANGGTLMAPRLMKSITDRGGSVVQRSDPQRDRSGDQPGERGGHDQHDGGRRARGHRHGRRPVQHRGHGGRQDRHRRDQRPRPRTRPGSSASRRPRTRGWPSRSWSRTPRARAAPWPRPSPPRSCAPPSTRGIREPPARRPRRGPLRAGAPARRRRHGARLPRPRPAARPPGGGQGAVRALRVRPPVRRALPPRGLGRRRAQPPEHRRGVRPRRGRRQLLHRHGVPVRARPEAGHPRQRRPCRPSRPSTTPSRSWRPSARPTAATSSTATSSPRTCWWRRTAT